MYNFSGVLYRIWGVCGIILIMGVILILFEKPWKKDFKIRNCKFGLIMIAISICLGLIYGSRIVFPDVSSYTGEFIDSHRNSRVAPITHEYVFWNGEGKKQVFYLDTLSKKEVFPHGFVSGQTYTVYFDEYTSVIVKVEAIT